MIDWSRFAGSLWDNILAAHVHSDNLADKVMSFEAAIDEFNTTTFLAVGQQWPVYPYRRFQYVRMCFDNLRLMGQRAIRSSTQLESRADTQLQVAFTSVISARSPGLDTEGALLLRYQMVNTLAASLHMMCSAVVSHPKSFESAPSYSTSQCQDELDVTVRQLHALAQDVLPAQRVLGDLNGIVREIRDALAMVYEKGSTVERTAGWAFFGDFMPPNAADLLPYRDRVPDIRSPVNPNEMWSTNNGYLETDRGMSPWNAGLGPGSTRSSVLWI